MINTLKLISKIKIGDSAEYPVLRVMSEEYGRVGPSNQSRESYEEITWTLRCLAQASAPTTIRAFNQTLRTTLAKRGVDVVLTERGQATTLAAAGSLPGYPRVEHTATPEMSFGPWQSFDLRITDRRPLPDNDDLVEHTYTRRTSTNAEGGVETRQSGQVRLANGEDAAAWVATEIFAGAASTASSGGLAFVKSIETNQDAAWCSYEYTISPVTNSGGIAGLTSASKEDRTSQDTEGRGRRVISGYATGPNAATWAAAQALGTIPIDTRLVRQEGPTPASLPDGRVSFRYEYAVGKVKSGFSGIYILDLVERIYPVSGGNEIEVAEYLGGDPVLRRGPERAYVYRQESSIRYLGGTLDTHGLTGLMSADNLAWPDRYVKRLEGPIREVSITREYVYTSPQTVPSPRTLEVL
jgi:hypothetical protein